MIKAKYHVKGMHCTSCEDIITDALNEIEGVSGKANYKKNVLLVEYDEKLLNEKQIIKVVKNLGYSISNNEEEKFDIFDYLKIIFIVLGLNYITLTLFNLNLFELAYSLVNNVPVVQENSSYILLLGIGILTSFHCVAMCGGINIAQCMAFDKTKETTINPNLLYNLGRVTSYTIIGGFVGAIGSVLTISISIQAMFSIIIGVFMVLMGINLYGVNFFRKLIPTMPKKFKNINKSDKGPFVVGLLNGFMPCGPLQSMQLYALSTGSFLTGAMSMFIFSVGTVPAMYIFGMIGSYKSGKLSSKVMKISAILVIVLGFSMITRGSSILGFVMPNSIDEDTIVTASAENDNVQYIYTDLEPYSYPPIVVKKGVPVKWVINATPETLNGCNNEIIIRAYNIQKPLVVGENVIEFTPTESGRFGYSCWMGMITSTITVVTN